MLIYVSVLLFCKYYHIIKLTVLTYYFKLAAPTSEKNQYSTSKGGA